MQDAKTHTLTNSTGAKRQFFQSGRWERQSDFSCQFCNSHYQNKPPPRWHFLLQMFQKKGFSLFRQIDVRLFPALLAGPDHLLCCQLQAKALLIYKSSCVLNGHFSKRHITFTFTQIWPSLSTRSVNCIKSGTESHRSRLYCQKMCKKKTKNTIQESVK